MEVINAVKRLEAQGRHIVRLEVGEPDFPTPPPVLAAAHRSLAQDQTRYTAAMGVMELRQAVADWYLRQYRVSVDPSRVVITPGTSGAFLLAFGILLDWGDRVAISDPGYPCYPNMIRLLGGQPVAVAVGPEEHYQLSPESLRPALEQGLKGALITSPSNPTGTLIPDAALEQVIAMVEQEGGRVISDEIYHGITYERRARSALEFSQEVIIINGFSKFFAMTGWRLGWMIVPPSALRHVESLQQNLFISAPTLSQYAALAAFECEDWLRQQIQVFDHNRLYLVAALRDLGFLIPVMPTGAFYVYADASRVLARTGHVDTLTFCHDLLERSGVAVTPGLDFGHHQAGTHLRFSFATTTENVREGISRLGEFLRAALPQDTS
ncbi:MAG: aminotransferase class I/II-fold pyridoxal phosphate-dependent enzyme [Magnetococcales bacterium]|nr:aminotransferase class I/II-fold pyridoxal phosphate-dependent enzyme [Magnetococcales bacterium]